MMPMLIRLSPFAVAVAATWGSLPCLLSAQTAPEPTVVHLRSYSAGWLHRLILGDLHREYWDLPVEAPVLDLARFAGGLTPLRQGGGLQTRSLRFQSGNGPVYTFRSIEKDATRNLDAQLQGTLAATVLQDQIGALFPLSAMVVAPLLDAAGVLHANPELVVLPDGPQLGEFRADFAGLVGWIEVRPDEGAGGEPSFAGADRVVSTPTFLERLEAEPDHRADAAAFLRARLLDLYVGDWDRHPDQWRWAAFAEASGLTRWYPIPRDRDWALNSIDGLVWSLVRRVIPQYVGFDEDYTSIFGTVWNGRALDRHLLSELPWSAWEPILAQLQVALSDDVIDRAVDRLPPAFRMRAGPGLRQALRARRDALPAAGREYYGLLAGWVDVFLTDEPEFAHIERLSDGSLQVVVTARPSRGLAEKPPHFERTFLPHETREVRLYLRGAADSVEVAGVQNGGIAVRVMGGGGDDYLADRTDGVRVGFYDHRGDNRILGSARTTVDERDYEEPDDTESATHGARARDWGTRWLAYPQLGANRDVGLFLGQTLHWSRYGFRRFPYARRLEARGIVNPVNIGFQASLTWRANLSTHGARQWVTRLDGASRIVRYFHGIGNETTLAGDAEYHRADRTDARLFSGIQWGAKRRRSLRVGATFGYSQPIRSEDDRFIQSDEPNGFGTFAQVGAEAELILDGRDNPVAPTRGLQVTVRAQATPAWLDQADAALRVDVAGTATSSLGPVVGTAYADAAGLLGTPPWFDLVALGGQSSLRGFRQDRFLGHGSLLGGLEIRAPLAPIFVLFPGTVGLSAFGETGRVYERNRRSSVWHPAYGGGVWVSMLSADYTLSGTLARSRESTRYYVTLGFAR